MIAELDRLSEKVEMARETIVKLKEDNRLLEAECHDLKERATLAEGSARSAEEVESLLERVDSLSKEKDDLLREREQVVERVRGLLQKVEALEELS